MHIHKAIIQSSVISVRLGMARPSPLAAERYPNRPVIPLDGDGR